MSRYTGPRARVSRRLGTNIWGTSGENKAMENRRIPPGNTAVPVDVETSASTCFSFKRSRRLVLPTA
ncbi:unannotated protein [freshwater metagenome]|uniref:Unannotated protein n=1 Tax=freshwater metagenome TaxID=449393 RepID=A0A6J6SL81_9ZZZZ